MSDAKARFYFADIVVVKRGRDRLIGCVVKSWHNDRRGYHYEVYVRSDNAISEHDEGKLQRYVQSKELSSDEEDFHL